LIRGQGIEEQFVVNGWTGGAECFLPALTRAMALRYHEAIDLDPQLNGVPGSALLENWLRDSDASRIPNVHKFNLHGTHRRRIYIVSTETQKRPSASVIFLRHNGSDSDRSRLVVGHGTTWWPRTFEGERAWFCQEFYERALKEAL
jgi:hypothetical protein